MADPVDGFGVYESFSISGGSAVWRPRLQAIANAGFKIIVYYDILGGGATPMVNYINDAFSLYGLKVFVAGLQNPAIWRDNTYSTTFPTMYADSGNAATGTLFMQYIVNQVKGLSGLYGYYIGDELLVGDHATFAPYAAAVHTADSTHPRMIMLSAGSATNACWNQTSPYYDSTDIIGDDFYPYGYSDPTYANRPYASVMGGVQQFVTAHSLQGTYACQAQSWGNYTIPGAPWPTLYNMAIQRRWAFHTMTPKLVMWYSWFDAVSGTAPANQPIWLAEAIMTPSLRPLRNQVTS